MTIQLVQQQPATRKALPPGPKGNWLTGSLFQFRRDMLAFLTTCARDFGDICSFRLGYRQHVLINDPEWIHKVLVTDNNQYVRPYNYLFLQSSIGNGLLLNEGKSWMRQRRLMQPLFLKKMLGGYAESAVRITQKFIQRWQDGESRDLHADMMRLTLLIVADVIIGIEVDNDADIVERTLDAVMDDYKFRLETGLNLPTWIPISQNRRLRSTLSELNKLIDARIASRRAHPGEHDDVLSRLMQAQDEDRQSMSDELLRDEVITMLFAGHETTANTLSWTFGLLAQHPDIEAQTVSEIQQQLGGEIPRANDLERLSFTQRVLLESMRLYPTAYLLGRKARQEVQIGDYHLPDGVTVFMSQWVTHRDERYFPQAEQFRPQRWENGTQSLPEQAYFPFGAGPRLCIGKDFGMMEAMLILATVLPKFRFSPVENKMPTPWPSVTLRPQEGVKVTIHKR